MCPENKAKEVWHPFQTGLQEFLFQSRSPALQEDSLPTELIGKPGLHLVFSNPSKDFSSGASGKEPFCQCKRPRFNP